MYDYDALSRHNNAPKNGHNASCWVIMGGVIFYAVTSEKEHQKITRNTYFWHQ